jgi:hypothetical protein
MLARLTECLTLADARRGSFTLKIRQIQKVTLNHEMLYSEALRTQIFRGCKVAVWEQCDAINST